MHSVTLTGYITDNAPQDKDLYIEFVGDSITCAWGTIGTYDGTYTGQDSTDSFAYLIAEDLNADYAITALSGHGITDDCHGVPTLEGYKYPSHLKDTTDLYDFSRKPDVLVINIGTNDVAYASSEEFYADFKEFVLFAREKNGEDCIFMALYGMMNHTMQTQIKKVFAELGGEANTYYAMSMPLQTHIHNTHPSPEDNKTYADTVAPKLKELLGIQ